MMGALWVLSSLQLKVQLPMTVYVDNMPTINLIKNKVCNSESKHIDIKYFWSRQLVQRGLVDVKWARMVSVYLNPGLCDPVVSPKTAAGELGP